MKKIFLLVPLIMFIFSAETHAQEKTVCGFSEIQGEWLILKSSPNNKLNRATWRATRQTLITLDGEKVRLQELAGKSLRVTVRIDSSADYYPAIPLPFSMGLSRKDEAISIQAISIPPDSCK